MGLKKQSRNQLIQHIRQGKLKLCVIGLGRVGLPTAAVFAKAGAKVIGADINQETVKKINDGKNPLVDEPGLDGLIKEMARKGNLTATANVIDGTTGSDAIIICVPTPIDERKVPEYSAIEKACTQTGKTIKKESIIIVESTVGPGTVESTIVPILEKTSKLKAGKDFGVASCPERGDPGKMLENLYSVPRVIGGVDTESTNVTSWLYEVALGVKVIRVSDPKTANAVKLTENLFRDVNIALANEFALLYEKLGIDTIEVINACATKYNFMPHYPGAGVGGPCLPQNSYYLIVEGVKAGNIPYLIRLAREVNDRMPDHVVILVTEALNEAGKTVSKAKITILGVTYKSNIHDLQLTPMKSVITQLVDMGGRLNIFDPMFKNEDVFGIRAASTLQDAADGSDCIVIGTSHKEFYDIDLAKLWQMCNKPAALVDARNVINPEKAKKQGFVFRGVGRR